MKAFHRPGRADRAHGIALVAVLWIVAALSVLVTGVMQAHRAEIRVVAVARDAAQARADGQAAIQLALQRLSDRSEPLARVSQIAVNWDRRPFRVIVWPLNGLIDLNRAPPALLSSLFAVAGGVDGSTATTLAETVTAARQPGIGRTRGARFEAPEDLLLLPGFDYVLYARLFRLLTTESSGSGRVNPLSAPDAVLRVLAAGDERLAAEIAAKRDAGDAGIDTTRLAVDFIDSAPASRVRLEVRIPLADGRVWSVAHTADLESSAQQGVPWRILNVEDQLASP